VLLINGRIYTMGPSGSVVDALVIRDGRVVFAGQRAGANPGAGERVVDLGGRAVLPGLIDAHAHLALLAETRLTLDLRHAASEEDVARRVANVARTLGPGAWITGRWWDETRWPERRLPTTASLDHAAPERPVALTRVDGHATWASSAALRRAGITRETGDPQGGRVVKGGDGEPTGLLIDAAQDVVRRIVPRPAEDRFDQAVRESVAECLAKGLTGIHEMGADLYTLASYRRLIDRGHFPIRNSAAVRGREAWAYFRERGPETAGDGRLVVGALKLWLDGALGSRGALLHAPYCDDPGNSGLCLIPPEEVERLAREAVERGFQVCVHAIGDRANTLALDAFERVLGAAPVALDRAGPVGLARLAPVPAGETPLPPLELSLASRPAFRVEHAQVLALGDIARFRRLGVLPSMQPAHAISDMRWAGERLGPDRLAGAYAWRSLLDTGTIIAGGSDFPVEDPNPFQGIYAAVTRRPLSGEDPGWQPGQRMTRDEAVRSFTIWNAVATGQEGEQGSLEPGKRADLVVLSDDVFTCPEDRIKDIAPMMTMVGGEVVFERAVRS
jgi:predicted amidohydrolase YtcJ